MMNRRDFLAAGTLAAGLACHPRGVSQAFVAPAIEEPLQIGNVPQHFIDDHLVDNRWSLKPKKEEVLRVFHAPQKHDRNPLLRGPIGYVNVARDPQSGACKLWYQTHYRAPGSEEGNEYAIAYAESSDGLEWTQPRLDLHEWQGAHGNNVVWKGKGGKRASGPQILDVPEKDRRGYKYLLTYRTGGVREASGIRVVGSQDGIHWDEPNDSLIAALHSDTVNSIVFDELSREYVMTCRPKDRYLVGGRTDALINGESRRIARMSSRDLWTPWTGQPTTILIPDELDMQRGFNRFYGMPLKRYAGITWGFIWPFKLNTDIVTELVWSRDGWNWQRFPTRPRLLELGVDGAWDDGMVFGSPDWVEMGDEWWLYFAGSDGPHESHERDGGLGVATLRKEGFISMHGPAGGGVVCTRRLQWPGGKLVVNADASAGELRVRVSNDYRKLIPGFDFADCQTFRGNSTAHEVAWKEQSLAALKGQNVRLEFHLQNADLYSFRAAETI